MSKRLQVILDDQELAEIRRVARRHRMTTAEWVRQALRAARRGEPTTEAKTKLGAVRAAVRNAFPIADIDRLLAEIESGYSGPAPE